MGLGGIPIKRPLVAGSSIQVVRPSPFHMEKGDYRISQEKANKLQNR